MYHLARTTLWLAAAALAHLMLAPSVGAQETTPAPSTAGPPALDPGARVRIDLQGRGERVGTLVALTADTLFALWGGMPDTMAVPMANVTRLSVSEGPYTRTWGGVGVGVLVGGLGGAAVSAATWKEEEEPDFFTPSDRREAAQQGAIVFGALGGIIGGFIGAQQRDRWRDVPLGVERARVGLMLSRPGQPGMGIAAALSF